MMNTGDKDIVTTLEDLDTPCTHISMGRHSFHANEFVGIK